MGSKKIKYISWSELLKKFCKYYINKYNEDNCGYKLEYFNSTVIDTGCKVSNCPFQREIGKLLKLKRMNKKVREMKKEWKNDT